MVRDYSDRVGLTFPKVTDPDSRIASAYGVPDWTSDDAQGHHGFCHQVPGPLLHRQVRLSCAHAADRRPDSRADRRGAHRDQPMTTRRLRAPWTNNSAFAVPPERPVVVIVENPLTAATIDWQGDLEPGPSAGSVAVSQDLSAMGLDDGLGDGQADAASGAACCAGGVASVEAFEQPRGDGGVEPVAGVGNRDPASVLVAGGG